MESPHFPRPKTAWKLRSKIKIMLIAFFDARGVVRFRFLPQGQTINQHVYKETMRRLLRAVQTRRPEMRKNKS